MLEKNGKQDVFQKRICYNEEKKEGRVKMIRAVVFDCGNVLNAFQPIAYYRKQGYEKTLCERICKEMFQSEEWQRYDQGLLTFSSLIEKLKEKYQEDAKWIDVFAKQWLYVLEMIPAHQQLLDELSEQGYRVYLLSNIAQESWDYVSKKGNYRERFDGWVLSFEEKLIKPQEQIYRILLERYQLDAKECLFLDDLQSNVEAARKIGMQALQVTSQDMRKTVWRYIKEQANEGTK